MVLDVILGSVLLAFGIVAIYFSTENSDGDSNYLVVLLISLAAIIAGGWILITRITIPVLLTKLAGLVLAAIGAFLVFQFPDITDYQKKGMGITGILLGFVFLILGVYLLIFY